MWYMVHPQWESTTLLSYLTKRGKSSPWPQSKISLKLTIASELRRRVGREVAHNWNANVEHQRTMRSAPHFREPSGARHLLDSFGPSHRFEQEGGTTSNSLLLMRAKKVQLRPPLNPQSSVKEITCCFHSFFFVCSKENGQLE